MPPVPFDHAKKSFSASAGRIEFGQSTAGHRKGRGLGGTLGDEDTT